MGKSNLNRLEYFVAIVEAGTITAAARRLDVSKAVVSRQLQLLEQDLGATLILRNSRHMGLTEAGHSLFAAAQASLAQVQEALENIREGGRTPSGMLRIAAPLDLGIKYLAPFVARFRSDYPAVSIDLRLSDTRHDLVESRFDISYRVGWLADSANVARKLADFQQIIVGSPDVVASIGAVGHPDDLRDAPFIRHHALADPLRWRFSGNGGEIVEIDFTEGSSTDVTPAVKAMCLAGAGLAVLPSFEIQDELMQGMLVRCAPDWALPSGGIYAVYPPTAYRSAATQLFTGEFAMNLTSRLR